MERCSSGSCASSSLARRPSSLLARCLLAGLLLPAPALAALGKQVVDLAEGEAIVLARIEDSGIHVDGHLDEAFWRRLPAWDEFVLVEPDSLAAPRYATRVRAFYDSGGLYFGIDMDQPQGTLVSRLSGRDLRVISRDSINITLDTSGEGRYGYWFGINLGDSLMDGTLLPERQFSQDWDGAWRGRSQATAGGWSAEFHIPWGTVAMPQQQGQRRLGLYMSRKVAHLDQRWGWPGLPATVPKFISALQSLLLEGIDPKQEYSVFPFVSTGRDRVEGRDNHRTGADFFWRPSTNFQLTATLNPDFGAVESDDVVINLSATETFFPEKRLFFLEGQQIFVTSPRADLRGISGVGRTGQPTTLLNTRRIGGRPLGHDFPSSIEVPDKETAQPVELDAALKMTGQYGRLRYGVLAAGEGDLKFDALQDGRPVNLPGHSSDYGVVRVLYEDAPGGPYRAFGMMTTAALNPLYDAKTHGMDIHYLAEDGSLKLDFQAYMSDIEGEETGFGGFLDFEYTFRKGLVQRLGIEYNDPHVDLNDLGFLWRNDDFRLRSAHTRTSPGLHRARDNQFDARGFVQISKDELFTGGGVFLANRTVFNNLSSLVLRGHWYPESYDDLNSFGNGAFRVENRSDFFLNWNSDSSRRFSYGFGLGLPDEVLGGATWNASLRATWRPTDRFSLSARARYRSRKGWLLHDGDADDPYMTAYQAIQWRPSINADYFINARQQFRVALQWVGIRAEKHSFYRIPEVPGDLIRLASQEGAPGSFSLSQLSMQLRYRWEIAPLSDVFLVYTRLADRTLPLQSFGDTFRGGYDNPLADFFILKIRYRFGS